MYIDQNVTLFGDLDFLFPAALQEVSLDKVIFLPISCIPGARTST